MGQPVGNLDQKMVADIMTQRIIHLLEMVEIDQRDGKADAGAGERLFGQQQMVHHRAAVGEAGQGVAMRLFPYGVPHDQTGNDLIVAVDDEADHQQRNRDHAPPHHQLVKAAEQYHGKCGGQDAHDQNGDRGSFYTGQAMGDAGRPEDQRHGNEYLVFKCVGCHDKDRPEAQEGHDADRKQAEIAQQFSRGAPELLMVGKPHPHDHPDQAGQCKYSHPGIIDDRHAFVRGQDHHCQKIEDGDQIQHRHVSHCPSQLHILDRGLDFRRNFRGQPRSLPEQRPFFPE